MRTVFKRAYLLCTSPSARRHWSDFPSTLDDQNNGDAQAVQYIDAQHMYYVIQGALQWKTFKKDLVSFFLAISLEISLAKLVIYFASKLFIQVL